MTENKTVLKAHDVIKKRIDVLVDKKQRLRDWCDEKWPYETHGVTADVEFDDRSRKIEKELEELRLYDRGFYDLIDGVNEEMERRRNRKL